MKKFFVLLNFLSMAYTEVLTGLEVLQKQNFKILQGKRVGLITNHTGVTKKGEHIFDLLYNAKDIKVVAIFSPEHGFWGDKDVLIDGVYYEPKTKIPIYSLYGKIKKPTPEMLKDIDILVFDIQDIGARFYTYITTLALCMQAAKENNKQIVVLDRPNPITGVYVEGNVTDKKFLGGFASYYPLCVRHGMTIGELALMFNKEFGIKCKLKVIKMKGWKRKMWFDETGIPWINTSPNIRSLQAATLYPGVAYFEAGTNVTEGRGTEKPFEYIGAPWIDGELWAKELNSRNIPGVRFVPIKFTPVAYKYKGQECGGVYVEIVDRDKLKVVELGLHMLDSVIKLYPDKFVLPEGFDVLAGNSYIREMLLVREPVEKIVQRWQPELEKFLKIRKKYLLYD